MTSVVKGIRRGTTLSLSHRQNVCPCITHNGGLGGMHFMRTGKKHRSLRGLMAVFLIVIAVAASRWTVNLKSSDTGSVSSDSDWKLILVNRSHTIPSGYDVGKLTTLSNGKQESRSENLCRYRIYCYLISIISVPTTISTRPKAAFLDRRSLKTIAEKAIDTRILSLSIGTTTLAGPSCSAL